MVAGAGGGCALEVMLTGRVGTGGGSKGFKLGFIIIGSINIGSIICGLVDGVVMSENA